MSLSISSPLHKIVKKDNIAKNGSNHDTTSANVYINQINANSQHAQNDPLMYPTECKIGPFGSIKYNNPSVTQSKLRLYGVDDEDEDTNKGKKYHDFTTKRSIFDREDTSDEEDSEENKHSRILPKWCLPLRILLLALYLATTLSSFWILDSIKEPTLAILVNGELGKHQPRAKMTSFVVVIIIAVGMEYIAQVKKKQRRRSSNKGDTARTRMESLDSIRFNGSDDFLPVQEYDDNDPNAEIENSWKERDLPSSMQQSRWKTMKTRTSYYWERRHFFGNNNNHDDNESSSSSSNKISTVAFYLVGSVYIHFFITAALALRQHPSFSKFGSEKASETEESWYYPALGYFLFALIESYGSVAITIFWAFTNSHLTLEAAEKHYGSIIALAQAGAIGGSTLSALLGRQRTTEIISDGEGRVDVDIDHVVQEDTGAKVTPLLIFLACGCIAVGMVIMGTYAKLFSKPMRPTCSAIVEEADDNERRIEYQDNSDDAENDDHHHIGDVLLQNDEYDNTEEFTTAKCNISGSSNSILKDLFGGVDMIFRHEYLKLVLAVSVLYEIALTCMHYEMNLIGLDRFGVGISIVDETTTHEEGNANEDTSGSNNGEGITYIQFMGWYGQTVNILSLFLSFYAFPRLIKNYGLSTTIRVFPTVLLLVTICAFVLFPQNLYFLFISLSLCKALTYSVHDPSEEVLYMPTSDDAKFRAKFWIDVVGQRVAKAIGSVINNYAGSIERIVKYGSLPSVVASLALWLACYQVGVLFDKLIKTGEIVAGPEEVEEPLLAPHELELSTQVIDQEEEENDNGSKEGER